MGTVAVVIVPVPKRYDAWNIPCRFLSLEIFVYWRKNAAPTLGCVHQIFIEKKHNMSLVLIFGNVKVELSIALFDKLTYCLIMAVILWNEEPMHAVLIRSEKTHQSRSKKRELKKKLLMDHGLCASLQSEEYNTSLHNTICIQFVYNLNTICITSYIEIVNSKSF